MIKGISLQNFMSFDDIELDMTDKGGRCMDHAYIFGENGSGKTNLVDSLVFLVKSTMTFFNDGWHWSNEWRPFGKSRNDQWTGVDGIDDILPDYRMIGAEGGTRLTFRFEIDGYDATYSLEFGKGCLVQSESLDFVVRKKSGNLFRITKDGARLQKDMVTGTYRKEIHYLIERYWGKHTFLAILMHEIWAKNRSFTDSAISENMRSFLGYIRSLVIMKDGEYFTPYSERFDMPSGFVRVKDFDRFDGFETALSKLFTRSYSDIRSVYFKRDYYPDGNISYRLYFEKEIAGKTRTIPAKDESYGTKRMIDILQSILLCAEGRTVIIDGIDLGIHGLLISQLLEQCIPDITGQLIVTTHDISLMTYRDAPNTFIISIDRHGYKRIDSIQSIEPPNVKTNVQKRYVEGYYSGIPLIADVGLKDIYETSMRKGR